jgi:hypothetical protein
VAFKVKFDPNSINSAEKKIKDGFKKVIESKQMLNEVGTLIVKDIQFQTRRGYSIPQDRKFKPLTQKWINKRSRIAQADSVHETFKSNRSNLTLTGQLLDSLKHRILGAGKLLLEFTGVHRPYKIRTRKGIGKIGKQIPNEELAKYVSQVRPFVGVRDKIKIRIKNVVVAYIRRSAKVLNFFE